MRTSMIDFSSWSSVLTTLLGLLVMTLLMVGIRLLFMQTIQKRRERENRQINERLKTLMAAYKTLGGSFTGQLAVSPVHLRDLHAARPERIAATSEALDAPASDDLDAEESAPAPSSSERQRRMRDAVEGALSDVILLGTEAQVAMAAQAAQDMVAGRHIETAALVTSLRTYVRAALDLEPIPASIAIPNQGPARTGGSAGGGAPRRNAGAGANNGGSGGGGQGGAGGGGAGGGAGGGMGGASIGLGMGGLRRGEGTDPD